METVKMSVPAWVQDSIIYQIFPDRFANGDPSNDPANVREWNASPTIKGFHGGDLRGVVDHFDYLLDLGVTVIYFNPIFQSGSTHRYDTYDYYRIDPKLGTMDDFHALLETAHANHVRIILDGVFNHCGRGFFAFNDLLENGSESPYLNWFTVKQFPLEAYTPGDAKNYKAWWNYKSLPEFNTDEPAVRDYLLGVARFWIDQGADGWRLDVPNEIDDDAFWASFRRVVREANPQAYIVGEIWDGNPRWVGETHFDGLMNYPVREALIDILNGKITVDAFAHKVETLLTLYPPENVSAMMVLLGSHDTKRIMTKLKNHTDKARLAHLFQFSYPGAPSIYYGDEIGMEGGADPDCRRAFIWDETKWNVALREWIQKLIAVRKQQNALRRGEYLPLDVTESTYVFARILGLEKIIIVMNFSEEAQKIKVNLTKKLGLNASFGAQDLLSGETLTVEEGKLKLNLNPYQGILLKLPERI
ncbi:MAG: glycoside hydrolase family 13 protein [Anaerolineaceae bacterium]|nr:glycoside hydrolase family 13 protein [Anaerolineaceae bacterium]